MATKVNAVTSTPSAGKSKRHKVCGVCGDRARSYHFGGISCDSCKAFFRRAVQRELYKDYICAFDGNCEMRSLRRKCCQSCRFDSCRSIGMEPAWVRSEDERKQLKESKQDLKKSEPLRRKELETYNPNPQKLPEFLSEEELVVINELMTTVRESIKQYPLSAERRKGQKATYMLAKLLLRCNHMIKMLPLFAELSAGDQRILLGAGILEICFLQGAANYDEEKNYYKIPQYVHDTEEEWIPVTLEIEELEKVLMPELCERNRKFIKGFQDLQPDQKTSMLLCLLVIFCPERAGLSDPERVSSIQEKYILILKRYMECQYGPRNASVLFPKLLTKLSDLQEISDLHTEDNVCLGSNDVEELQEAFGSLNVNPYTQFDLCEYKVRHTSTNKEYMCTDASDEGSTTFTDGLLGYESLVDSIQDATFEDFDISFLPNFECDLENVVPTLDNSSASCAEKQNESVNYCTTSVSYSQVSHETSDNGSNDRYEQYCVPDSAAANTTEFDGYYSDLTYPNNVPVTSDGSYGSENNCSECHGFDNNSDFFQDLQNVPDVVSGQFTFEDTDFLNNEVSWLERLFSVNV